MAALKMRSFQVTVDGKAYPVRVEQRVFEPPSSPRIVVVVYQPNALASEMVRVFLGSIRRFTPEPHELWIVDNHSPKDHSRWLLDQPGINVILNDAEPLPPGGHAVRTRRLFPFRFVPSQVQSASYANGLGLELATQIIHPETQILCTFHSDVLVCKKGWLTFLRSKLNDRVRGASTFHDLKWSQAMHVAGLLFDFTLFRSMKMTFLPSLADHYDVGDLITKRLKEAGYGIYVCRNTLNHPETAQWVASNHPFYGLTCPRSFDEEQDVIYLHMGRGTTKLLGLYRRTGRIYPEEWIRFAQEELLREESQVPCP